LSKNLGKKYSHTVESAGSQMAFQEASVTGQVGSTASAKTSGSQRQTTEIEPEWGRNDILEK